MKTTKKWIISGIMMAIFIAAGWWFWQKQHSDQAPKFETVFAERKTLFDTVEAPGTVVPRNRVEIIPPIGGRMETIMVKEGDHVRNGTVMAIMSSTDRAALLDVARSESPRQAKYWDSVYQPTRLFAPLNGQVIVRNVEPGQTVNASTVVFVIADSLIVKAQVDETDIGKIKNGMSVLVSLDAYTDTVVTGNVDHISYESTIVNNVSVYDVEIVLPVVPNFFRSGMTATAKIIRDQRNDVVAVPDRAIQYGRSGAHLIPKTKMEAPHSGKKNRGVRIKTGISANGWTEIASGKVKPGDAFLVPLESDKIGGARKKGLISFGGRPGGGGGSRGGGRSQDGGSRQR